MMFRTAKVLFNGEPIEVHCYISMDEVRHAARMAGLLPMDGKPVMLSRKRGETEWEICPETKLVEMSAMREDEQFVSQPIDDAS